MWSIFTTSIFLQIIQNVKRTAVYFAIKERYSLNRITNISI